MILISRKEFREPDREKVLLWCDRHCCLCGKQCGGNIEIHHIDKEDDNNISNAIPLCFECHGQIHAYKNTPKGAKFKPNELRRRRDQIYSKHTAYLVPIVNFWVEANQKIRFITLSKKRFFGFETRKTGTTEFNISSREKTIIDCLLLPQYCGGITKIAKGLWSARKQIDWNTLLKYVEEIGVEAVKRRLGFILEELKIKKDVRKKLCKEFVGFVWADPSGYKKEFHYNKKWGLKVNLEEKELTQWMES